MVKNDLPTTISDLYDSDPYTSPTSIKLTQKKSHSRAIFILIINVILIGLRAYLTQLMKTNINKVTSSYSNIDHILGTFVADLAYIIDFLIIGSLYFVRYRKHIKTRSLGCGWILSIPHNVLCIGALFLIIYSIKHTLGTDPSKPYSSYGTRNVIGGEGAGYIYIFFFLGYLTYILFFVLFMLRSIYKLICYPCPTISYEGDSDSEGDRN